MKQIYEVCCREGLHSYEVFEDEKDAKTKVKRYNTQRLTCPECGCRDWVVVKTSDPQQRKTGSLRCFTCGLRCSGFCLEIF